MRPANATLFGFCMFMTTHLVVAHTAGVGRASAGNFQLGLPDDAVTGTVGRQLHQQQAEDFAVSSGVFANVAPCQPLLDILTDTPEPGSNLGNFTEQPSEEVLRDCTDNNSAYLLQGTALADALRQAEPKLKVFKLAPPTTEWPLRTTAPRFVPGSVNLINCQHEFLDLRSWPIHATTENTTLIIIDCQVLYPDLANTLTTLVWNINTGTIFPCNGASALSKSANYPRSAPRVFGGDGAPLIAPLSPISTVHVRNGSLWCYNDADIAEIIPLSDEDTEGRGASLPSWALPVIVAGILALVCVMLCTLWVACGRPYCSCSRAEPAASQARSQPDRGSLVKATGTEKSTEELAEALSVVLKTHRCRTAAQHMDTLSSTKNSSQRHACFEPPSIHSSQETRYYEAPPVIRECPDCGQPHPEPSPPPYRARSSLRAQSDTHSGSGSGGGARGGDSMQCMHCAAHLGIAVERLRSVKEMREDMRNEMYMHESRSPYLHDVPKRAYARPERRLLTREGTEAWVEDSLEARAAMTTGWDHASEAQSVDGQCSTASISLAPPRHGATESVEVCSKAIGALQSPPQPPIQGSRQIPGHSPDHSMVDGSPAISQQAHGGIGALRHMPAPPPRIMEPLRGLHDADGGTRIPWLPPQEGFIPSPRGSPRGSPRRGLDFSDRSAFPHPRLQH